MSERKPLPPTMPASPAPAAPAASAAHGSRSTARLAAVQALYQQATTPRPLAVLLHEFHQHRLKSAPIDDEDAALQPADQPFFDDLVSGCLARQDELDTAIGRFLQPGWSVSRLDRLMQQILRCGSYEMLARPDVPLAAVVSEYVDVARAFYDRKESGFVNAVLDRLGKAVRAA